MLLCVDTGALRSCIRNMGLQRIVHHPGCKSIPIIYAKRDFKFGDIMVKYRGMLEPIRPHLDQNVI